MAKIFLYLILFVIIIALIIWVGAIILALFALLQFIKSLINYVKTKDLQATEMRCPNCGSVDIKINSLQTGAETQSSFSGVGSSTSFNFLGFNTIGSLGGDSHSSTAFTFKREGICQQCGFNYDYLTKEDVTKIKNNNKLALIASSIFLIVVVIFGIYISTSNSDSNDSSSSNIEESGTVWATEYTSINNFDYYIDGNNLYLKEYIGVEEKVKINSIYEINGNNYNVVSFVEGVFTFTDVTSVILPESLTTMPNNTFNGCDVKYIYIPATLQMDNTSYPFTRYFDDVEVIYYGGTEEHWKKLTNNEDRAKIDAKQIVYNANLLELK